MTTLTEKLAFRPDEAARVIGASRDTIFRLLASGELRGFKIGAARFIAASELADFIKRQEEKRV